MSKRAISGKEKMKIRCGDRTWKSYGRVYSICTAYVVPTIAPSYYIQRTSDVRCIIRT